VGHPDVLDVLVLDVLVLDVLVLDVLVLDVLVLVVFVAAIAFGAARPSRLTPVALSASPRLRAQSIEYGIQDLRVPFVVCVEIGSRAVSERPQTLRPRLATGLP